MFPSVISSREFFSNCAKIPRHLLLLSCKLLVDKTSTAYAVIYFDLDPSGEVIGFSFAIRMF